MLASCEADKGSNATPGLVVEGWIDNGRFPVVILTRTVPITGEYQPIDNLTDYAERWATVRVSDGKREVTLIATYDEKYFPPYVYTTSEMRGETGKTYRLTVDCTDGSHAEAVTSIPASVPIDSFELKNVGEADTLRQLYGFITDTRDSMRYYKLFTHVTGDDYGYLSSYLGIVSSDLLPADGRVAVNQGRINLRKDFTPYFAIGDTVLVKLACMDAPAYKFWREFEDILTLSRNPLFPVTNNMSSNVSGALGYWFGYGSTFYTVTVDP